MFQHTAIAFRHMQPFHAKTGLPLTCANVSGKPVKIDREYSALRAIWKADASARHAH